MFRVLLGLGQLPPALLTALLFTQQQGGLPGIPLLEVDRTFAGAWLCRHYRGDVGGRFDRIVLRSNRLRTEGYEWRQHDECSPVALMSARRSTT
ncbi:hypothetical protein D9M71_770570 [compost metagenome]